MFHHHRKSSTSGTSKALKDLVRHIPAAQFLAEDKRLVLLQKMEELSGLEDSRYESICAVLVENLVNYCQSLPETSNSYYSHAGGLVDHALNRTEAALSLFKEFMVLDEAGILSEEQKLWQYALYSAAILQGIGKLFVDFRIDLYDMNGQVLTEWNPLLGSLIHTGTYYDYEFQKESDIEFRRRLNLLLARALMPSSGFDWIASNPQILAVWLALLNEDPRSAGTLGAILIRADSLALQRYLLEFTNKSSGNRAGRYRAGTFSGGVPESVLQKEQIVGVEFIQWLNLALAEGRILVNKAPLLMVPGGMLMCQEIFQLFVREHPEYKNWLAVQTGFLSLGLHHRNADGSNLNRFEHIHNQKMYSGVVFSEYAVAIPDSVKVMQVNTGKVETMSATELVNRAQFPSNFTQQHNTIAVTPLQQLSTAGQWQHVEVEASSLAPGAKNNG